MEASTTTGPGSGPVVTPDWLKRRAFLTPHRPALVLEGVQLSFAQLDASVDHLCRRLRGWGVSPEQRVAILMPNGRTFVELVHAVARIQAVLVPLNIRLTPRELAFQLNDVGAGYLVYDPSQADKVVQLASLCPQVKRVASRPGGLEGDLSLDDLADGTGDGVGAPGAAQAFGGQEAGIAVAGIAATGNGEAGHGQADSGEGFALDRVHSIIYTSGTTGHPKGAMLTFGNHWWSAVASALNLGLQPQDRWLACLPLFHVGGLSILLRSVIYGIPVVVHSSFDPAAVNRTIDQDGVTIVSLVSNMLQRMLDERGTRSFPNHFRCALVGGGPVPRPLLERAAAQGVPVVQTYGLTEAASQVATLAPEDALRKLGSAGKPLFATQLRIVQDGRPLPAGEVGEIVVRGPTITPGYYGRPEATRQAFRDGWFHTGDLGYLDEEGYLYVVERRTDLIISGGENVYPAEVEAVLLAHPDVEEAGVVGVPDARWGQVVGAAVRLRPGCTPDPEGLRAFCRSRLAAYKVPSHVRFVDSLPRNSAGKLVRRALLELFEGVEGST